MIDSTTYSNLSSYSDLFEIIINFLPIIIALLTFWLAFKVHKEFSRNHAKAKQVERMSNLLAFLNNTRIYLDFSDFEKGSATSTSLGINYNIFEIGDLFNKDIIHTGTGMSLNFAEFDDDPVILDRQSVQIMNIKKFIDDSFIPKKIADELLNFYVFSTEIIRYEDLQNTRVVILNSTEKFETHDIFKQPSCEVLRSWLNFKTHAFTLSNEIKKWFLTQGVKDFNLRIDYKNIRSFT